MANEDRLYQDLGAAGIAEKVTIRSSAGVEPTITNTAGVLDGIASIGSTIYNSAFNELFNGSSWDRQRGISGIQATPYSGMSSTAITTAVTTAVKASKGIVGTISNAGNAITGIITVYDSLSASGTKLWSGTLAAGQVLPLGIPCGTGITVVTAAADTIAVSFA